MNIKHVRNIATALAVIGLVVLGTTRVFAAFHDTQSALNQTQTLLESTVVPTVSPTQEVTTIESGVEDETIGDDISEVNGSVGAAQGEETEIEESGSSDSEMADNSSQSQSSNSTEMESSTSQGGGALMDTGEQKDSASLTTQTLPSSSRLIPSQIQRSSGGENEHESHGGD